MRLPHLLAMICALSSSLCSMAYAATIEIPRPYVVYLQDGKTAKSSALNAERKVNLSAGAHQLVIRFEGSFKDQSDTRLVSGEPVVINLDLKGDEALAIKFAYPRNYRAAEQFIAQQKLTFIDTKSGATVNVDHFVMPKKEGLQIGRDYQAELLAMGKGFQQVPADVALATTATMAATAAPDAKLNAQGSVDKNAQTIEMLKYWYNQADAETRKNFQHWIISQQ